MKTFMIIMLFIICYFPTLIITSITPYITRRTESFGIGIPEEEYSSTEVKNIRENYRNKTLAFGGFIAVISLILTLVNPSNLTFILFPAGTFIFIAIMFAFYWQGHIRMKKLKAEKNWMAKKTSWWLWIPALETGKSWHPRCGLCLI